MFYPPPPRTNCCDSKMSSSYISIFITELKMAALAASDLPVEKCELHKPPLEELAKVRTKLYHKQF